jgi:hypothetical protein
MAQCEIRQDIAFFDDLDSGSTKSPGMPKIWRAPWSFSAASKAWASVGMGASWGTGFVLTVCRMTESKSSLTFAGKWLKVIGSRVKFSEAAMANLLDDWTSHGPAVLVRVREE